MNEAGAKTGGVQRRDAGLFSAWLSPEECRLLPAPADLLFYEQHGWWVAPVCVGDEVIDELWYHVERYYAGERDARLPVDPGTDWKPENGAAVVRQNDYLSLQMAEIAAFVRRPLLPAMAAILARSEAIHLFHDQLIYKPPAADSAATVVGWHTDRAYWRTCSSSAMLTAWVALQDCTPEMGPLVVWDASHRSGHDTLHGFADHDLAGARTGLEADGGPVQPVPLMLRKGQVSFHHCLTVHGSHANHSARTRAGFAIHYQDGENRYRPTMGPGGRPAAHLNDVLCRRDVHGRPDYQDPAICPRLWPPASADAADAGGRPGRD